MLLVITREDTGAREDGTVYYAQYVSVPDDLADRAVALLEDTYDADAVAHLVANEIPATPVPHKFVEMLAP